MLVISSAGLALLKEFEGFRSEAYVCPGGKLTIGYGTTKGVQKGDKITERQAEILLKSDLIRFEYIVQHRVRVPLTQNQFDALVCFVYNVGEAAFLDSTLLKELNAGNYHKVPSELIKWCKVTKEATDKSGRKVKIKVELDGLADRRRREAELFTKA